MPRTPRTCLLLTLVAAAIAFAASPARAQFSTNGPTLPLHNPTGGEAAQGNTNFTPKQIQQLYLLRYLQGRSGGGVKRGVPQFIPFGSQPFMGNMRPTQQVAPRQPSTDNAVDAGHKSAAEMRAEYEASREERRQKIRERAERRLREAEARRAAKSGGK